MAATPPHDPAAPASPDAPDASPLSPRQWRELNEARRRRGKLDRAAKVAALGGWVTAVLAACAALFVLGALAFGSLGWVSAILAVSLGVIAYHEFKGRRLLLAIDPAGPRVLGWNQVGFAALIIAYSIYQILIALTGQGAYARAIEADPALAHALGPMRSLVTMIELSVYILLILGTLAFQGGKAWYYFTREKHLRAYRAQTPPWAVELIKQNAR